MQRKYFDIKTMSLEDIILLLASSGLIDQELCPGIDKFRYI